MNPEGKIRTPRFRPGRHLRQLSLYSETYDALGKCPKDSDPDSFNLSFTFLATGGFSSADFRRSRGQDSDGEI